MSETDERPGLERLKEEFEHVSGDDDSLARLLSQIKGKLAAAEDIVRKREAHTKKPLTTALHAEQNAAGRELATSRALRIAPKDERQ